jgi:(R,R)-butanediol dehydrogenase/meso-butanediol dehydrogenase/diacetyl reductase
VVEPGANVTRFKAGDRVTMNALLVCGECPYCRRGAYNMCLKLGSTGFAADGGFAEYAALPEYALYHLPPAISDDKGSFAEPLAVAVRAVKRSRMQIGDVAVVVGAGPIGLLVLQVCRAVGASRVFVIEPMRARRELAARIGAAAVFDPRDGDPGKAVSDLTDGLRAEVAFDCVGNQSAFDTALKVTGRRGVVCVAGLSLKPVQVPFMRLWGHEKEVTFSSGYENEFPAAIGLLADGRVDVESLISARIELADLVEKGFSPLINQADRYVKILVYP